MQQAAAQTQSDALRRQFGEEMRRCVVSGNFEAPRLPHLAMEIMALTQDPNASFKQVAAVLARDQGLAARVLHLANSAFFPGQPTERLSQAMARIGLNRLKQLLCAYAVKGKTFSSPMFKAAMTDVWAHSVAAGVAADMIAKRCGRPDERAFVAGLLHDLGRSVAIHVATDVIRTQPNIAVPCHEDLMSLVDQVHCVLGRIMATRWKLPQCYIEVMGHHHDGTFYDGPERDLVLVVAAADRICEALGIGYTQNEEMDLVGDPIFVELGLSDAQIGPIRAQLLARAHMFAA